jgi:hypothetical protein
MKILAWLSVISGALALLLLLATALDQPEWRSQVLTLSLPLTFSEPDVAPVLFLPSIALASLSLAAGAPAFRWRLARAGLILGAVSWLGILSIIGVRGLQTIF